LGFSSQGGSSYTATILDKNDNWFSFQIPEKETGVIHILNDIDISLIKGISFSGDNIVSDLKVHALPGPPTYKEGSWELEGINSVEQADGWKGLSGLENGWAATPPADRMLEINYRWKIEGTESVGLLIEGQGLSSEYDLYPGLDGGTLCFYVRDLGFTPESIESSGWVIESAVFNDLKTSAPEPLVPFKADTGTMLHFPRSAWRNNDYEVFSWTRFPHIIYLTTSDYATQAAFFKRLAFFVEKKGYSGTLVSNADLKYRFGWNAHDYSSQSLAEFYNLADEENFQLNPEEEILKELCQNAGIITWTSQGWEPENGAVVGLSIETDTVQRSIFMTHESIHGLYFTSDEFRRISADFWRELPKMQQDFWKEFLSYRGYNVLEDEELLHTEVAAYLLQQSQDIVDDYLIGFISPTILSRRPHTQEWLIPYLLENPTLFSESLCCLVDSINTLYGINASSFHELLPVNRSHWSPFTGLKDKWIAQQTE